MFSFFFKKKKKQTPPPTQPQSQNISTIKSNQSSTIKNQTQINQPNALTMKQPNNSDPIRQKLDQDPIRQKLDQDNDQWIYEYILQYLTSPLWKIPISQFIDENCLIFDSEEVNQYAYTDVHNSFKTMIEKMLEELIKEINITEEKFMAQVEKGLKVEGHKRIFDQLLVVDNFIVFKKLMVKRNKELELEATRALEQQELEKLQAMNPNVTGVPLNQNMERIKLETEKAQIEHAIAMSLAIEEEKKKLKEQEDYELQQVLKQSEMEYQKQQEKLNSSKNEKLEKLEKPENIEKVEKIVPIPEKVEKTPEKIEKTPEKIAFLTDSQFQKTNNDNIQESVIVSKNLDNLSPESFSKQENVVEKPETKKPIVEKKKKPVEEQKEFIVAKESPKKNVTVEEDDGPIFHSKVKPQKESMPLVKKESNFSELPPLKPDLKYDPLSLNDLLKEKQSLAAKLDALKAKPSIIEELKASEIKPGSKEEGESFLERKKRLERQRELILKKKKEEREKELKEYKETGAVKGESEENQNKTQRPLLLQESIDFSQNKELLQKRQEIMKKFKENKD